jgi:hypothetical protein
MRGRWLLRGMRFAVMAAALVAVFSLVVMLLWNALVPGLFNGRVVGFWQAAGLLVLSRILFGGFLRRGWHGGWRHRWRERWERMTPEERTRFREGYARWSQMTPEERTEFRNAFGGRCGSLRRSPASRPPQPTGGTPG